MSQITKKQSVFKRLNWSANFPTFICKHARSRIGTGNHQYFCEPKWKQKHYHAQIDGKCVLTNKCFKKLKRNKKTWENTIIQRSLLVMKFMLELQKLLMKYSKIEVRLLLGSFPFFITCSSLHENYGWRLGTSSIRDASSNRHIMVTLF